MNQTSRGKKIVYKTNTVQLGEKLIILDGHNDLRYVNLAKNKLWVYPRRRLAIINWIKNLAKLPKKRKLSPRTRWVAWNVYVNVVTGTIGKLPFPSKVEGVWRFDGQIFAPPNPKLKGEAD